MSRRKLYVALVHHPVVDKNGETIASAVTNLDLHDIARAARTYGVGAFYVVTPLEDQRALVKRLMDHWIEGMGASYNPMRKVALELIAVKRSLDEVQADVERRCRQTPKTVVTSARFESGDLDHAALRGMLEEEKPVILVFGTAWGLAPEALEKADYRLAAVTGPPESGYNHLSVRSAVAIILDRLCGLDR